MGAVKVATCCYCGTKAALVLRGDTRHQLSCSNCGAPLSRMKMLPNAAVVPVIQQRQFHPSPQFPDPQRRRKKPKKRKYRKRLFRKVVEEIWDEIEDIFD